METIIKKMQKWDEIHGAEVEEKVTADDNPLKNAEMAMEDDYDSIDGIINNGSKKDEEEELKAEQHSVMEKIHEHEEKIKQQNRAPEPEKKRTPLCTCNEVC